jgi:hypothetical protein
MKHQRTPTLIEDVSDDESLSQGPLCKKQKRDGLATALTLESLIRAGEVLNQKDIESEASRDDLPSRSGRVTPTKVEDDCPTLRRKMIETALSDTLSALEDSKPMCIPPAFPALNASNDWRKTCRPLAAPPRLPNVPCGFIFHEKRGAIST